MQRRILRNKLFLCSSLIAMAGQAVAPAAMAGEVPLGTNDLNTKTPIKHVIVIYGENRSFDHVFGIYRALSGESVMNILSEGVVNDDGMPGPNFAKATQYQADGTGSFSISPPKAPPGNKRSMSMEVMP
jgi:phospholipase C